MAAFALLAHKVLVETVLSLDPGLPAWSEAAMNGRPGAGDFSRRELWAATGGGGPHSAASSPATN